MGSETRVDREPEGQLEQAQLAELGMDLGIGAAAGRALIQAFGPRNRYIDDWVSHHMRKGIIPGRTP
ncbi:hypothetical protein [Streptomyces sp. NPDC059957]|uniref:hypothetical protein n=1 Tax=unclassified Streptomyces TaxID=2593676 RepID=UPI00365FBAB5